MDAMNDETRRLTPEEADARLEALIAQYRNEEKNQRRVGTGSSFPPSLGWIFVYLAGVVGGAVCHAKPLLAVFVGVPVILVARVMLKRSQPESE